MGFYDRYVMPRIIGAVCGHRFFDPWRERLCAGLDGDIIELGFGSGMNLKFLPAGVRRLDAIEPSQVARRSAAAALESSPIDVHFLELDDPEIATSSRDGALCAFTLCSVENPAGVLDRLARVMKPGAPLHFLEHGLAPDAATATWQRRLDGLEQRLAGGCHLTRDPLKLLADSPFEVVSYEQNYAGGPRPWSYFTLGAARTHRAR